MSKKFLFRLTALAVSTAAVILGVVVASAGPARAYEAQGGVEDPTELPPAPPWIQSDKDDYAPGARHVDRRELAAG